MWTSHDNVSIYTSKFTTRIWRVPFKTSILTCLWSVSLPSPTKNISQRWWIKPCKSSSSSPRESVTARSSSSKLLRICSSRSNKTASWRKCAPIYTRHGFSTRSRSWRVNLSSPPTISNQPWPTPTSRTPRARQLGSTWETRKSKRSLIHPRVHWTAIGTKCLMAQSTLKRSWERNRRCRRPRHKSFLNLSTINPTAKLTTFSKENPHRKWQE